MDHNAVAATNAVERYLLSEMPPGELDAFEQHFFECDECAAEVSSGAAFMANAQAVFAEDKQPRVAPEVAPEPKRWFGFLRPVWGVGLAGMVLALGLFQTVQRFPMGVTAQQMTPILLSPGEVRGEGDRHVYKPGATIPLKLDIERGDAAGPHVFELRDAVTMEEISRLNATITPEDIRQGKEIRFRDRKITADRRYVVVLRKPDGTETDRYFFKLDSK